jgi:hypothetical protein
MPVNRGSIDASCSGSDGVGVYLNQVLALRLRDQWLQLRRGERVHQTGLGDDEKKDLSARQDGQFIRLS